MTPYPVSMARRWLIGGVLSLTLGVWPAMAETQSRLISIDAAGPTRLRDQMSQFSIGADYPAVTGRPDALAQLRVVVDELGFRYIRFHDIFHDDMGVYREVDGRPVYDWTHVDRLYDQFLAMGIKPFIELGFTPDAMKTSDQKSSHTAHCRLTPPFTGSRRTTLISKGRATRDSVCNGLLCFDHEFNSA